MSLTTITRPQTFRTFVTGPQNALAYNAALTVARAPGTVYNPLFLAGGPGLGKTHLLRAIADYLVHHVIAAAPIVVTGDAFAADYEASLRRGTLCVFRRRYRHADALLLDGVSVLAGHPIAAQELVQTLNALGEAHRQIVIADERRPANMRHLPPCLAAHLSTCLVATLRPPDGATRLAILRHLTAAWRIPLGDDVLAALASQVSESVQYLDAIVARLATEAAAGTPMTPMRATTIAREIISRAQHTRGEARAEAVLQAVCAYYGLGRPILLGKSRALMVAQARQVAMYLLRDDAGLTSTQVGHILDRDHSTVLHGYGRIVRALTVGDPLLRAVIHDIRRGIAQRRCA